jgi:serine/threonine protein kinase
MGNLMEKFCCVDNNDIIYNQNYPQSFNDKSEKNYTLRKNEKEKLPSSQIDLGLSRNFESVENISRIPISSKNVIIKKKGDPLADYEILNIIGEGTYGKVYKVRNKKNKEIRAMKQISKYWLDNLNDNEVMKEIEILKYLNHPYIIKLYEYYVSDNYIFLINELCDEGDLQGKIKKIKIFPEFIVKIIMLQVFKALMYLNEKRIIHGDLKLENILVVCYESEEEKRNKKKDYDNDGFINAIKHDMELINGGINAIKTYKTYHKYQNIDSKQINDINKILKEKDQRQAINSYTTFRFRASKKDKKEKTDKKEDKKEDKLNINDKMKNIYESDLFQIYNYGIKLIDFGCSKMFTRTKKNFSDIIGTLVYCAPEVLSNNYNESCDVWSCGVLMYCLLCGHFPFKGSDEEEITRAILSGKFDFDIDYFNGVSDEAKDLIKKCLKYDPNKRISIQEALNHIFFKDINESKKFTEEDIKQLTHLKKLNKYSKFYQLVLTYLSYNFSDNKLLNEFSQLYDKLDKNNDYKITKAELYKAYKEARIPISQKELESIINSMDFDNNGNVDYEEFVRMCIPKEKLFTDSNLENAFYLFDKEKKGFITPSEIIDFINSTKKVNEDVKKKIKDEILDIADEIIDIEEFKSLMITMSNTDV